MMTSTTKLPEVIVLMPVRDNVRPETQIALSCNLSLHFRLVTVVGEPVDIARNRLADIAKKSTSKWVVWIDADCWFEPGTVETMIRVLDERPSISVLAAYSSIRWPFCPPQACSGIGNGDIWPVLPGSLVPIESSGMTLIAHGRSLFDRLGDEPFTPGADYTEDMAFFRRVKAIGEKAMLIHSGSAVAHIDDDGTAYFPGMPPARIVGNRWEIADHRTQDEIVADYDRRLAVRRATRDVRSYGPAVDAAARNALGWSAKEGAA